MLALIATFAAMPSSAQASHAWLDFHWPRAENPFRVRLGDNVSSVWDPYLAEASQQWTASSVLNTRIVAGSTTGRRCLPTLGRVEVCNYTYGNTNWLGLATVWANGGHIYQAIAQMNDTYFNVAPYRNRAWRRLVMCQEVGHTFGLAHQDEDQFNANLGSCMDYSNDPNGPPSNERPNLHDYEMLEAIYAHLDGNGDDDASRLSGLASADYEAFINADMQAVESWGVEMSKSADGRTSLYMRDFGNGLKTFTFVFWVP
jgi:hypothetical protein